MDKLTLCVFIDALGWELLRGRTFLDDVLCSRAPLQTIFGYSCTCCPTILTGALPREHGHLAFYYYDPQGSPFRLLRGLRHLPASLVDRGRVRRLLSRGIARLYGFDGYFQLYNVPFERLPYFNYCEKRDLYQRGGINGGQPTIFDVLRARGIPFHVSNWRRPEAHNLAALEHSLAEGRVRFAYLYLAAMDAQLHAEGTRVPSVDARLRWYEARLRRVLHLARRHYGEVRLFLFSDHGMTDVEETCDLKSRIERLGLRFGSDYAAAYDSTMARFWFLRDRARDRIVAALRDEPRGRILEDEELTSYGCDFPDRKYGELFYLLEPGVLLCPSDMGQRPLAGMHGYAPGDPRAAATFASNLADAPRPRRLDDLFDVMLRDALDLRPEAEVAV